MTKCPYCQTEIEEGVYRNTTCPNCGKNLHVCDCCRFYDENAHWHCRENIDELVKYTDQPNFCDYFALTDKSVAKKNNINKKAFENLFG